MEFITIYLCWLTLLQANYTQIICLFVDWTIIFTIYQTNAKNLELVNYQMYIWDQVNGQSKENKNILKYIAITKMVQLMVDVFLVGYISLKTYKHQYGADNQQQEC